jgi:hypothetical protein
LFYFVFFWYIFSRFGMLHQEKSGNPGPRPRRKESASVRPQQMCSFVVMASPSPLRPIMCRLFYASLHFRQKKTFSRSRLHCLARHMIASLNWSLFFTDKKKTS